MKIFDDMSDHVELAYAHSEPNPEDPTGEKMMRPLRVSVVIGFSLEGYGFGDITIAQDGEGQRYIDTECSSPETVAKIISMLLDSAITDYDEDPVRHARFNKFMRRRCSEVCRGCHPPAALDTAGEKEGDGQ